MKTLHNLLMTHRQEEERKTTMEINKPKKLMLKQ